MYLLVRTETTYLSANGDPRRIPKNIEVYLLTMEQEKEKMNHPGVCSVFTLVNEIMTLENVSTIYYFDFIQYGSGIRIWLKHLCSPCPSFCRIFKDCSPQNHDHLIFEIENTVSFLFYSKGLSIHIYVSIFIKDYTA